MLQFSSILWLKQVDYLPMANPIIYPKNTFLQKRCDVFFDKIRQYSKEPKLYDTFIVDRILEKAHMNIMGYREFTMGQKIVIVREWVKSGLSPSNFRKTHNISEDSLVKWIKKYNNYFIPYTYRKEIKPSLLLRNAISGSKQDKTILDKFITIILEPDADYKVNTLVEEILLTCGKLGGLKILSLVQKKVIIDCWEYLKKRGETKTNFCTRHNIGEGIMGKWRKQLKIYKADSSDP